VIVHTGPYVLSTPPGGVAGSATRFKVQAAQTAAVDEHGAYARLRRDRTLDLALVKEDGEWRIDAPPDGVLLAATDVARVFRLRDVFFLDSQQAVVIADLVLMPSSATSPTPSSACSWPGRRRPSLPRCAPP
jgi:hypothetical protein